MEQESRKRGIRSTRSEVDTSKQAMQNISCNQGHCKDELFAFDEVFIRNSQDARQVLACFDVSLPTGLLLLDAEMKQHLSPAPTCDLHQPSRVMVTLEALSIADSSSAWRVRYSFFSRVVETLVRPGTL